MTAADHPVATQSVAGRRRGKPPEDRRRVIRRRLITATIIVLLIGIPAGYLLISAGQSRRSGKDKEAEAAAHGLREGWPSKMQRRIFEMPDPRQRGSGVQYYETNNWKASRMYVQVPDDLRRPRPLPERRRHRPRGPGARRGHHQRPGHRHHRAGTSARA